MEQQLIKPWYKKKRYLIPIGVVALLSLGGSSGQTPTSNVVTPAIQNVQSATYSSGMSASQLSASTQTVNALTPAADTSLSNNNYYTNTAGNEVHAPAYSNSIPSGASARCGDGTYSFSQSRRGTCSRHGGVASWL